MEERRQNGILILSILMFMFLSSVLAEVKDDPFTPADNYLINCGSSDSTLLDDGRIFKSDPQSASYLSTDETILASVNSIPKLPSHSPLPLYLTARIFHHQSMYRFLVFKPGLHWVRLYLYPIPHPGYDLTKAVFSVTADDVVLLHDFCVKDMVVFKEYLVNVSSAQFTLKFSPLKNSVAFINALEVVSAPDDLIPDSAAALSPPGDFSGLNKHAFEAVYRVNVGGPMVNPKNDTLWRIWAGDEQFMKFPQGAKTVSVPPTSIRYTEGGASAWVAPRWVYATGDEMADADVAEKNFNLTWEVGVDPSFSYLIRLHFCDIVSKGLNELYFNVYVNGILGVSNLDLSTLTSGLAVPYYKDFVLNATAIGNATIIVQIGPTSNLQSALPNAILNGMEVLKISNSDGSLDGLFSSGVVPRPNGTKIAASIGLAMGVTAIVLLAFGILKWVQMRRRRPNKGWEKQRTFSSWLPLNASYCSFMSSKSKTSSTILPSGLSFGKVFTLNEIKTATNNFDEKAVIGVGGFGKVYLGEVEDWTKVAIKRGNPSSSQGINEFQTEIQMLSKLRHRHLVSLIGYCDEQSEMILVYEYMSNGPLRDHIYGSNVTPLSWRQRLEICIGAARGLHYLHTGSTQGIIHRDVKTTNILLDHNFVAKMADFGLSKTGPSLEQTHVSTAVKGSFGYLDPEYFRRQQLTEKSDVYSFGVVLFEVLCGRPALDPALPRQQVNLAEWAMQQNRKGEIEKMIDPEIAGSISGESLRKYVEAAEKCLAEYGVDRPSMGDVLWNLECALQLQDKNNKIIDISEDSGVVLASPIFEDNIHGR